MKNFKSITKLITFLMILISFAHADGNEFDHLPLIAKLEGNEVIKAIASREYLGTDILTIGLKSCAGGKFSFEGTDNEKVKFLFVSPKNKKYNVSGFLKTEVYTDIADNERTSFVERQDDSSYSSEMVVAFDEKINKRKFYRYTLRKSFFGDDDGFESNLSFNRVVKKYKDSSYIQYDSNFGFLCSNGF